MRLALIGEVGQFALGKHRAAGGDRSRLVRCLGHLHSLGERLTEAGTQPLHAFAGTGRAAVVLLEGGVAALGKRQDAEPAATESGDVQGPVTGPQQICGPLLGDLLRQARNDRRRQPLRMRAGGNDA